MAKLLARVGFWTLLQSAHRWRLVAGFAAAFSLDWILQTPDWQWSCLAELPTTADYWPKLCSANRHGILATVAGRVNPWHVLQPAHHRCPVAGLPSMSFVWKFVQSADRQRIVASVAPTVVLRTGIQPAD